MFATTSDLGVLAAPQYLHILGGGLVTIAVSDGRGIAHLPRSEAARNSVWSSPFRSGARPDQPRTSAIADHATALPLQCRAPLRRLQSPDLPGAAVMDPVAPEPAQRAARPPQDRVDAHHKARWRGPRPPRGSDARERTQDPIEERDSSGLVQTGVRNSDRFGT